MGRGRRSSRRKGGGEGGGEGDGDGKGIEGKGTGSGSGIGVGSGSLGAIVGRWGVGGPRGPLPFRLPRGGARLFGLSTRRRLRRRQRQR